MPPLPVWGGSTGCQFLLELLLPVPWKGLGLLPPPSGSPPCRTSLSRSNPSSVLRLLPWGSIPFADLQSFLRLFHQRPPPRTRAHTHSHAHVHTRTYVHMRVRTHMHIHTGLKACERQARPLARAHLHCDPLPSWVWAAHGNSANTDRANEGTKVPPSGRQREQRAHLPPCPQGKVQNAKMVKNGRI